MNSMEKYDILQIVLNRLKKLAPYTFDFYLSHYIVAIDETFEAITKLEGSHPRMITPTKFNLSEKIELVDVLGGGYDKPFLKIRDVKEFIRLLKEAKGIEHDGSFIAISILRDFIDTLAGDKLT